MIKVCREKRFEKNDLFIHVRDLSEEELMNKISFVFVNNYCLYHLVRK